MYNIASEETYKDDQIILKEGSPGDWVYVVLSGSVEISKTVGARKYVIEVLKPNEIFGELGFLGGIKRTATARALGETTLGIIDRTSLDQEFNKGSIKRFHGHNDRFPCWFEGGSMTIPRF